MVPSVFQILYSILYGEFRFGSGFETEDGTEDSWFRLEFTVRELTLGLGV